MRCKNCGSENDDNLYICQNCGSPLYDEEEEINNKTDETQVFNAIDDQNDRPVRKNTGSSNKDNDKKKKQQTIAIIIILAVILVAIIVGIIAAATHKSNPDDTTVTVSDSTTISTTGEPATEAATRQTTTKATTTEATTKETTTTTTTTTTTEATTFTVTLSCNDGGEVSGDGTYKRGQNVTVVAKSDVGYQFDGWYNGSAKVSSNTKYTFTVTDNTNLEAVFVLINDEVDTLDGGTD